MTSPEEIPNQYPGRMEKRGRMQGDYQADFKDNGRQDPRGNWNRRRGNWLAVNTSYAEILKYLKANRPDYKTPRPLEKNGRPVDMGRFCDHHQDYGHTVEQCISLKKWVESLMKRGELPQFVLDKQHDHMERQAIQQQQERSAEFVEHTRRNRIIQRENGGEAAVEEPDENLVYVYSIMGGYKPRGIMSLEDKKKQLAEIRSKGMRGSRVIESDPYTFNNREYIVLPRPADTTAGEEDRKDSLVISVTIKSLNSGRPNFCLGRILIDTGSSVDLIYFNTLKKMGLTEMDLMPGRGDLQSFSGERVWPVGMIRLTVILARVEVSTLFHVVDSPDPYAAILGRPWLDSLGAVSSPLHRCLSFYDKNGKCQTVYADPVGTMECAILATQLKKTGTGKRKRENPGIGVADNNGRKPESDDQDPKVQVSDNF